MLIPLLVLVPRGFTDGYGSPAHSIVSQTYSTAAAISTQLSSDEMQKAQAEWDAIFSNAHPLRSVAWAHYKTVNSCRALWRVRWPTAFARAVGKCIFSRPQNYKHYY
jgi:hypothetical protein